MSASNPVQSTMKPASISRMPSVGLDARHRAVLGRLHRVDQPGHGPVPAFLSPSRELFLPESANGRVRPADGLVERRAIRAFEPAHPALELTAPDGLRVVEALVGPSITASPTHEDARPVRPRHVGPEDVHDVRLGPVLVAVVDQALEDARRDDAATAEDHGSGARQQVAIDRLVGLVGVDHPGVVLVGLAVGLQVAEELQTRVADGDVHPAAAVSRTPGGVGVVAAW